MITLRLALFFPYWWMLSDNSSMLAAVSKSLSPSNQPRQTRGFLPWVWGVWTLHFNSSFTQMEFPRPAPGSACYPIPSGTAFFLLCVWAEGHDCTWYKFLKMSVLKHWWRITFTPHEHPKPHLSVTTHIGKHASLLVGTFLGTLCAWGQGSHLSSFCSWGNWGRRGQPTWVWDRSLNSLWPHQ